MGTGRGGGRRSRVVAIVAVASAMALSGCAHLVRSSVGSNGEQASLRPTGASGLSRDGRYLAFFAGDSLAAGDTNGQGDGYVRDHATGTTELVTVADDEGQGDRGSGIPSMSDDGRFFAFISNATNLVPPADPDTLPDAFVRDRTAGTTRRVAGGAGAVETRISGNGRYVVSVVAGEVAPGIFVEGIVLTDLVTGAVTPVASPVIQPPITPPDFGGLSISDDGAVVLYASHSSHSLGLQFSSLSIWSRSTGSTTSVAGTSSPASVEGGVLSGDGRYVVFSSDIDFTAEPDTCEFELGDPTLPAACDPDVIRWDRTANAYALLPRPEVGPGGRYLPSAIDDAGRLVLIVTETHEPVFARQLWVHDRSTGSTRAVTAPSSSANLRGVISGDGRLTSFDVAERLVPEDTNGQSDQYVRRTLAPVVTGVTPNTLPRGTATRVVELRGDGFVPGTAVGALQPGLRIENIQVVNPSTIRMAVSVESGADPGPRDLFVVIPAAFPATGVGVTSTACFDCLSVT